MAAVKFVRIHGRIVPIKPRTAPAATAPKEAPQPAKPAPKKKGWSTAKKFAVGAVAIAAGVATYFALRKFRVSKIKELAGLQKQSEKYGLSIATGTRNKSVQKIEAAAYGAATSARGNGGVVLQQFDTATKKAKHVINPQDLQSVMGRKISFSDLFAGKRNVIPETYPLNTALKMKTSSKLHELFDSGKFIVKKDDAAMSKFADFANQKTLRTPQFSNLLKPRNARNAVIQETMKLTGEYRVHYLNGQVYGMSHRWLPEGPFKQLYSKFSKGGGAFMPVMNPAKRQEIRDFVSKHMKPLAKEWELGGKESLHTAFDIGDTKKGLRFIEAQPVMGTFANPIINRQFARHATGRWGKDVAALGGLGAAGAAGTATAAALPGQSQPRRRKRK